MPVSFAWPKRPAPLEVIGRSVGRIEAPAKVTGQTRYAADYIPIGALWAKVLHSPVPHARIKRLDVSAARRLPGVRAVLTAQDVPSKLLGHRVKDTPILARDVVRHIGDRVAAVAADDADTAEAALGLIEVEYEELPAVFDQVEAQQSTAPVLHPDYAEYVRPPATTDPSLHNVQSITRFNMGDIERGFAESDVVFQHEFRTQMVHQGYLEPRCCTVQVDADGCIRVWIADQGPYKVREHLAEVVGYPVEEIIVQTLPVGASFGAKDDVLDAPLVFYLARATGKPVTLRWTYAEELLYGTPRHAAVVRLKTGLKANGRLWARQGQVIYNGGAYASMKPNPEANMTGGLQLGGSYRIPHTRLESRCVYTNQIPGGYMRAPGETQVHFAVETHMDMMASAIGMDPLEFRLLNCLEEGDVTPNGLKLRDVYCREVLERAAEVTGWREGRRAASGDGKLRGRGLALGDRHTGTSTASTKLILTPDGKLTLVSVLADVGPGAHTVMQQIVAEVMGVDPVEITLDLAATDRMPFDLGVKGASATYSSGTSAERSALGLIEVLRDRAAAEWGIPREKVSWQDGAAHVDASPPRSMNLKELARLDPETPAEASNTFTPPDKPDVLSFQAQVAEVAVDPETGQVEVERFTSVQDVSRVINPVTHQGQIEGAIAQGIGYALMEELSVEEGRVLTASLGDYKLPTIQDMPPLHTEYVQAEVGPGPFQAKGIGESGLSTVAPAIAAAIYDATGLRFTALPLTPSKIAAALHDQMASRPA